MQKILFSFCALFLLIHICAAQQPTKMQKAAANPYESAIKNFMLQLTAIAAGKEPLKKLTGDRQPQTAYGSTNYVSSLLFPGASTYVLDRGSIRWNNGIGTADWRWKANLLEFIKNTETERLKADQKLVAAAIQKFAPQAARKEDSKANYTGTVFTTEAWNADITANFAPEYGDIASLGLTVNFSMKMPFTKQQLNDSLMRELDTRMAASSSAKEKGLFIKEWAERLNAGGFDKSEITAQGKTVLGKAAARDLRTAFEMLMEWPQRTEDAKDMMDVLSYSDKESIRAMAQKVVDDYYNKNSAPKTEAAALPDWSAFKGVIKPENVGAEHKNFYDVVARDLSGVLQETFQMNGGSYYRYAQDYKISEGEYCYFSMSELKRNFTIVFYNEKAIGSKSFVNLTYEGMVTGDKRVTGGDCTLQTDCGYGKICKTTYTGTIQVDKIGSNGFTYTFRLKPNPDLAKSKYLWTVLFDYKK